LINSNFHTHAVYCDGQSTVREHIDAALAMGFRSLGFSGHGYVPYEGLFAGMTPEATRDYMDTVNRAREEYAGRLNIFAGLENDSVYMHPASCYDYTIGSVHCIKSGGRYHSVDSKEETVAGVITSEYNGDGIGFAVAYFGAVTEFASVKRADILGHIDLVRRFNGRNFFDEHDLRYRDAAAKALETAARSGYIIEVNTSPLSKGISEEFYPADFLLDIASELGAKIIVGSDAHIAANLNYAFEKAESVLRAKGFVERWELTPEGFAPVKL
jgi:histidinol-phosphatase (PHP family)